MKNMSKKINKQILISILMVFISLGLSAQKITKVSGVVYDAQSLKVLSNVQISSQHADKSSVTDKNGKFSIEIKSDKSILVAEGFGYLKKEVAVKNMSSINIYMNPTSTYMESIGYHLLGSYIDMEGQGGTGVSIRQQDFNLAQNTPDESLYGRVAGLRSISKGGMPGEGAALYNRGIRSLLGENSPLIIVDGVPYLPNGDMSPAVSGFSKNIFLPTNTKGIGNMTFLRGADAGMYGSLGGNGVLIINSESAVDLETRIEFHTIEGIGFITKRIPVLNSGQSKNYLADIGENKYADPEVLLDRLPFLSDDPNDKTRFLYMHETDWQDEITKPAFLSENTLKIKGGDAVAKYNLFLGTQQNDGVYDNTHLAKYFARIYSNINFSRRLLAEISVGLNYADYKLHEQGMVPYTNPFLTSLYQAPFMSVLQQSFAGTGELVNLPFYNPVNEELMQSNPAAVVDGVEATNRSYNMMISMGLRFELMKNLHVDGMFGLYYDQAKDDIFISGKNYGTIVPLRHGLAENTVRSSITKQLNYYGRFGGVFNKDLNDWDKLSIKVGGQLLTSKSEYDMGEGANTPTDFYTTLDRVTFGKMVNGDMQNWTWMNFYLNTDYYLAKQVRIGLGATIDGASSYGSNSGRWFALPYVKAGWNMRGLGVLKKADWLSDLTIRAEYAMLGNSRFSSKLSSYAFMSSGYLYSASLHRVGLPNSMLKPEKVLSSNIGLDFSVIGNRVSLGLDLYNERTKDMLLDNPQAVYQGFAFRYENAGEIETKGIEVNLRVNVLNRNDWNWLLGGNIAHFKSEVKSLGNVNSRVISYDDGAQSLLKVGESPYKFYGYKSEKVYTTSQEAREVGYLMRNGRRFEAGDIKFFDVNNDKYIDNSDKLIIGDPTPDFYGAFYSNLTYKKWNLFMNFTYSYGNDIYNAVRRSTSSMKDFANQDLSIARRWMIEGQETDVPRASYGDPTGNSRFSSRWIEDGSYLKLKELILSYTISEKIGIFNGIKAYVTGENLFTLTDYVGMDPEFSYSYDPSMLGMDLGKMPLPKNVKLGLILNF